MYGHDPYASVTYAHGPVGGDHGVFEEISSVSVSIIFSKPQYTTSKQVKVGGED